MQRSLSVARALSWTILAGLASCTDLPELPRDQCGNHIIERDEDCDGVGIGDNACSASCRLECTAKGACPEGWGCGSDGLCRQPSGQFTPFGGTLALSADRLALADFDGDGRADLLASRGSSLSVAYLDRHGLLPGTATVSYSPIDMYEDVPAVGDLNGDGTADLALRFGEGLGVLHGQQSRTLLPTAFAREPDTSLGEGDRLFAADVDLRGEAPGDEILAVRADGLYLVRTANQGDLPTKPLLSWPASGKALVARVPVGQILYTPPVPVTPPATTSYPIAPGAHVVLAFEGDDHVTVFEPMALQDPLVPESLAWNYEGTLSPPVVVTLPAGVTVTKTVFAASLTSSSGTAYLDLLIGGAGPGGEGLYYAANRASNSMRGFCSGQCATPNSAAPFVRIASDGGASEMPLAVGHLNGGNILDFITPSGIYIDDCSPGKPKSCQYQSVDLADPSKGVSASYVRRAIPDDPGGWTEALLSPFSTGGYGAILTASAQPGFTFYKTSATVSGFLNPFRVLTQSAVKNLRIGDFDGDAIVDVLFTQVSARATPSDPALESLHVAFGDPRGIPETPADLGDLGHVTRVLPAQLIQPPFPEDSITDVLVTTKTDAGSDLYTFRGSTDRQVQAPLLLFEPCAPPAGSTPASLGIPRYPAIGRFIPKKGADDATADIAVIYRTEAASGSSFALWAMHPGESISSSAICADKIGPGVITDPGSDDLLMVPVDLQGDGQDELLILPRGSSKLFVAAIEGDAWSIDAIDLGEAYVGITTVELGAHPGKPALRDVALWSATGVAVLWNDGTGTLAPDAAAKVSIADVACPRAGTEATAGAPTGVAALRLDASATRALVVVTENDTLLARLGDAKKRALGKATCATETFGGGGDAITRGDVDGDGVDDFVVARRGGVLVFKGVPVVQ